MHAEQKSDSKKSSCFGNYMLMFLCVFLSLVFTVHQHQDRTGTKWYHKVEKGQTTGSEIHLILGLKKLVSIMPILIPLLK